MVHKESSVSSRWFGEEGTRTAKLMMYLLLAVVLMSMDQHSQYIPRIRSAIETVVEPVFRLVSWPGKVFRSIDAYTASQAGLLEENRRLGEQLLATAGKVETQAALRQENTRLRALLGAASGRIYKFKFAEMIRVDLDPFSHKIWLDRGALNDVSIGQAVIDGLGIVGQVEDVHAHTSTVRLISDPDHALPVQISRTGLRTVAYGTGSTSKLLMPNVPLQADVAIGDTVVTSGLGDRFPVGFPVGEVAKIERKSGATFAKVFVHPYAALDRGREVLLIKSQPQITPPVDGS